MRQVFASCFSHVFSLWVNAWQRRQTAESRLMLRKSSECARAFKRGKITPFMHARHGVFTYYLGELEYWGKVGIGWKLEPTNDPVRRK
jgi:hypothetical protein